MYVYALWVCLVHVDIKGRHWNPCYLSYRWLWATPWVLVNKPRASAGATHIFNSCPIFLVSPSTTINILKGVQHHLPKTTLRLYFTSFRRVIIKNKDGSEPWRECDTLNTAGGDASRWRGLEVLRRELPLDPASPPPVIYPKDSRSDREDTR